jgi:hypothetical protein
LSKAGMPAKRVLHPASLTYSRQKASVAQAPLGACPGLPGDLRPFNGSKHKAVDTNVERSNS